MKIKAVGGFKNEFGSCATEGVQKSKSAELKVNHHSKTDFRSLTTIFWFVLVAVLLTAGNTSHAFSYNDFSERIDLKARKSYPRPYIDVLLTKARAGDVDAQVKVAKAYWGVYDHDLTDGERAGDRLQDGRWAVAWMKKAAEKGSGEANYSLAHWIEYLSYEETHDLHLDEINKDLQGDTDANGNVNYKGVIQSLYQKATDLGYLEYMVSQASSQASSVLYNDQTLRECENKFYRARNASTTTLPANSYEHLKIDFFKNEKFKTAIAQLEEAGEKGDASAYKELSDIYSRVSCVNSDYIPKGMEYLEKAAKIGGPDYQAQAGVAYLEGFNNLASYGNYRHKKDPERARYLLGKAASGGDVFAAWHLAELYAHGIGGPKDDKKALELYAQSAHSPLTTNMSTLLDLAEVHSQGKGVDRDEHAANMFYLMACFFNEKDGCRSLDKYFDETASNNEAIKAFLPGTTSADAADKNADIFDGYNSRVSLLEDEADKDEYDKFLTALDLYGKNSQPDTMLSLLQQASDAGVTQATNFLAKMYLEGFDVDRHLSKAVQLLESSAKHNNIQAMNTLGTIYAAGYGGLKKDEELARQWYKKSADAKDYVGMIRLGSLIETTSSSDQTRQQAQSLYQNALAIISHVALEDPGMFSSSSKSSAMLQEKARAIYTLGYLYETGKGVKQDPEKARQLYEIAIANSLPVGDYEDAINRTPANALYRLGGLYEHALGVDKSMNFAYLYYGIACEINSIHGCFMNSGFDL